MSDNTFKECIVPICTNTTVTAPKKAFFNIPSAIHLQKKWLKATYCPTPKNSKGQKGHICEDHFDLPNDLDNYFKYKYTPHLYPPKLKANAVPHQNLPGDVYLKNRQKLLDLEAESRKLKENLIAKSCKHTQVNFDKQLHALQNTASDSDEELNITDQEWHNAKNKAMMLSAMLEFPEIYVGIPRHIRHYIDLLRRNSWKRTKDMLIALRKIRLNEPIAILAIYFGSSNIDIYWILNRHAKTIGIFLRNLFKFDLPADSIQVALLFSGIHMVVASFDIYIADSRDPSDRSLKSCKFVIAMRPDGVIYHVSNGYTNGETDNAIFEACGLLNQATGTVLALNGFKDLPSLLQEKRGVNLIRQPSEEAMKLEDDLVQVAAICERCKNVIEKIRKFKMLSQTCVPEFPYKFPSIRFIESAMNIACALVNFETLYGLGIQYK